MRGICIDDTNSANLKKGEIYYLFPHGELAYYASRFDSEKSHFGAFQKNRFQIIDEKSQFKKGDCLKAYLWKEDKFLAKGHYYLKIASNDGEYAYVYDDPRFKVCLGGRFIKNFKDFEKHDPDMLPQEKITPEAEKCYKAYFWKKGKDIQPGTYYVKVCQFGWHVDVYSDKRMKNFIGSQRIGYFENFEEYDSANIIDYPQQYEQLSIFDLM